MRCNQQRRARAPLLAFTPARFARPWTGASSRAAGVTAVPFLTLSDSQRVLFPYEQAWSGYCTLRVAGGGPLPWLRPQVVLQSPAPTRYWPWQAGVVCGIRQSRAGRCGQHATCECRTHMRHGGRRMFAASAHWRALRASLHDATARPSRGRAGVREQPCRAACGA